MVDENINVKNLKSARAHEYTFITKNHKGAQMWSRKDYYYLLVLIQYVITVLPFVLLAEKVVVEMKLVLLVIGMLDNVNFVLISFWFWWFTSITVAIWFFDNWLWCAFSHCFLSIVWLAWLILCCDFNNTSLVSVLLLLPPFPCNVRKLAFDNWYW